VRHTGATQAHWFVRSITMVAPTRGTQLLPENLPARRRTRHSLQNSGKPRCMLKQREPTARPLLLNFCVVHHSLHVLQRLQRLAQLLRVFKRFGRRRHELQGPPNQESAVNVEGCCFQSVANLAQQRCLAYHLLKKLFSIFLLHQRATCNKHGQHVERLTSQAPSSGAAATSSAPASKAASRRASPPSPFTVTTPTFLRLKTRYHCCSAVRQGATDLNFQDMLFAPLNDPPNLENTARTAGPVLPRT